MFKLPIIGIIPPIVRAIIIIFIIVPRPGLSFNGNQKIRTIQLTMNVDKPTPILIFLAIPSANTVHGVTPFWETTKILSPTPNKKRPKQSSINVSVLGKIIFGLEELHEVIGTELIRKNLETISSIDLKNFIMLYKLNIRPI